MKLTLKDSEITRTLGRAGDVVSPTFFKGETQRGAERRHRGCRSSSVPPAQPFSVGRAVSASAHPSLLKEMPYLEDFCKWWNTNQVKMRGSDLSFNSSVKAFHLFIFNTSHASVHSFEINWHTLKFCKWVYLSIFYELQSAVKVGIFKNHQKGDLWLMQSTELSRFSCYAFIFIHSCMHACIYFFKYPWPDICLVFKIGQYLKQTFGLKTSLHSESYNSKH